MSKHGVLDQDADDRIILTPVESGFSPSMREGMVGNASNQNSINFQSMMGSNVGQESGSFRPGMIESNSRNHEAGSFRPMMSFNQQPEHLTWGASSFRPASMRKVKSTEDMQQSSLPHYSQGEYSYEPRPENRSRRLISWLKGKFVPHQDRGEYTENNEIVLGSFEEAMNKYHISDNEDPISPIGAKSPSRLYMENNGLGYVNRGASQMMPVILESGPDKNKENTNTDQAEVPKKNWLEARKEYRAVKQDASSNIGPPTETMMTVRDKIIRNKKLQVCYKVFRSLPSKNGCAADGPLTPRRDMPCTQRIFREEVERWIGLVKTCCSRPSSSY